MAGEAPDDDPCLGRRVVSEQTAEELLAVLDEGEDGADFAMRVAHVGDEEGRLQGDLEKEFPNIAFYKVENDGDGEEIAEKLECEHMPTLFIYKDTK